MKHFTAIMLAACFLGAINVFACDWHWNDHGNGHFRAGIVCMPTLIDPETDVDLGNWFEGQSAQDLPSGKSLTWKLYGPTTYRNSWGGTEAVDYTFSCTNDQDGHTALNSYHTGSTLYADGNSSARITGAWSGFDNLTGMTCRIENSCGGTGGTYVPITFTAQTITPGTEDGPLQFTVTLAVSMEI